jgi:hypothetical protein
MTSVRGLPRGINEWCDMVTHHFHEQVQPTTNAREFHRALMMGLATLTGPESGMKKSLIALVEP